MKHIYRLGSLILSASLMLFAACSGGGEKTYEDSAQTQAVAAPDSDASRITLTPVERGRGLAKTFNDSNRQQYVHAERLGIKPIEDLRGAYHTSRPIRHITSNPLYDVDELTHSMPYLVPEAAGLLEDVGRNFIDSLGKKGVKGYRIMVTSLLRTSATVKRLRRVNVNATDSSTHKFGTTFDISYVRFPENNPNRSMTQEQLKNTLGDVLFDLRNSHRCMVKYERKTGCFHVTVVR